MTSAQTLTLSAKYTLHADKEAHGRTVVALAPDQSLITIIGKNEGNWSMKRLSGWSGSSPKEETLQLRGFPSGRVSGWGDSTQADLVVSPNGRYAIARLQTVAPGMLSAVRKNTEAIVSVVDLVSFSVASTVDTTDPLLAGSVWQFMSNGTLVSRIGAAENPAQPNYSIVLERAAVLSMPSLQPDVVCTYRDVYGPAVWSNGSLHREVSTVDVSETCSALLKETGARTFDDLISPDPVKTKVSKQIDFRSPGFTFMGRNGCEMLDLSRDERFALYVCAASHPTWYDTVKTTALSYFVVNVPGAKEIGSVGVEPEKSSAAMLSRLNGHIFLLVLRNNVNLSVYRVEANN
jgi:hypothetical protein